MKLLISCEHASNYIPKNLQKNLNIPKEFLQSHQAWDFGALEMAKALQKSLQGPFYAGSLSRLIIDFNRNPQHPRLFSKWSELLAKPLKDKILSEHYHSYRLKVYKQIEKLSQNEACLHLSIHSFTPVLNQIERKNDLGILYDPASKFERKIANEIKTRLLKLHPDLSIRKNYPYLGKSDGLVTGLRKRFGHHKYCGIEIEWNQNLFHNKSKEDIQRLRVSFNKVIKGILSC